MSRWLQSRPQKRALSDKHGTGSHKKMKGAALSISTASAAAAVDSSTALFGSLSIVTYNIAMAQPSQEAPNDWSIRDNTDALHQIILDAQPDILALQECPSPEWPTQNPLGKVYECIGTPQLTHCGYVALLVHKERIHANYECQSVELVPPSLPMVLMKMQPRSNNDHEDSSSSSSARQQQRQSPSLFIASCHLEPFKDGAPVRFAQMQALCQQTVNHPAHHDHPLIIAGDMNMRAPEEPAMEQQLQLVDAWKVQDETDTTITNKTKFTWNSFVNQYHGPDAFSFRARFDRVYFHANQQCTMSVPSFQLIGNTPVKPEEDGDNGDVPKFYLSDHFGIAATIRATDWV